ncbi:hypothetical protein [Paenibacillus taichungensis]|uniref:hypothetical protein n=1 Tax=Paenibacillus taichungensis TaxID=484184 RepID=UPI003D9A2905
MLLWNIVLGFIIPVVIGGWILRKNLNILIVFYPLGVATSAFINSVGFNFFWNILPNTNNQSYAALPMDLGILPDFWLSDDVHHSCKGIKSWPVILLTSVILTLMEWFAKESGKILYFNGWNIYWTFLSYLVPLILVFSYGYFFNIRFKYWN